MTSLYKPTVHNESAHVLQHAGARRYCISDPAHAPQRKQGPFSFLSSGYDTFSLSQRLYAESAPTRERTNIAIAAVVA